MTGTLLTMPVLRAIDQNGQPMAGARLQFYLTGTTTPTNVYSSSTLATPLSNPVVADSGGLFAPIYLDPTIVYRCQLLTSAGILVEDIDPVSSTPGIAGGAVTAAMLAAGAAASNLGFAPLPAVQGTATNLMLAIAALATNSAGYLGLPINEQDGAYSTVMLDAGRMVRFAGTAAATYTLSPNLYVLGTAITFRNAAPGPGAGAVLTVAGGTGVQLVKAGTMTLQPSIALAAGGIFTAVMELNNIWLCSGVGMT
jgi:hypothetical protein